MGSRLVLSMQRRAAAFLTVGGICMMLNGLRMVAVRDVADADVRLPHQGVFVRPTVVDLGGVVASSKRRIDLVVSNRTGDPVTVVGVVGACGCVSSTTVAEPLPPFSEKRIPVNFRVPSRPGPFTSIVVVSFSRAANRMSAIVKVRGVVREDRNTDSSEQRPQRLTPRPDPLNVFNGTQ